MKRRCSPFFAERFKNSFDAVAGQVKNRGHAPFDQSFNEHIGSIHDENFMSLSLIGQRMPAALEEQVSRAFKTVSSRSAKPFAGVRHINSEYTQRRFGAAGCKFIRRQQIGHRLRRFCQNPGE
jgi:hypothetical protein